MNPVYLAYFDESGNTGLDLKDPRQPIFLLGALLVPASEWLSVESELSLLVENYFSEIPEENREIHTHKLISGSKPFRQYGRVHCLDFQRKWMQVAQRYQLKFFYRAIVKKQFGAWVNKTYGNAVQMNPHAMAFPLVSHVVNQHLKKMDGDPLGILISDEHKELSSDLEKSLRLLRADTGNLRHDRIIEKCFFIDSSKSLLLQLCDMCAYHARKREEQRMKHPIRDHQLEGISLLEPLIYKEEEALTEVIDWMDQQIKKRPGT